MERFKRWMTVKEEPDAVKIEMVKDGLGQETSEIAGGHLPSDSSARLSHVQSPRR